MKIGEQRSGNKWENGKPNRTSHLEKPQTDRDTKTEKANFSAQKPKTDPKKLLKSFNQKPPKFPSLNGID